MSRNHPFRGIKNRNELSKYIKKAGYKTICEVGVREGGNFRNMLKSNPDLAVAVDLWSPDDNINRSYGLNQEYWGGVYERFCESVADFKNVDIHRGYSFDMVKNFEDKFFDFVYIDGDHSYEGVKRDVADWYPKVKKGGILSGHDYGNPGNKKLTFKVAKAVNEFVKAKKLVNNFFTSREGNPSWFIII
jgi:hypothetical protein